MKYPLFFISISVWLFSEAVTNTTFFSFLIFWLSLNLTILGVAYAFNKASLICGKQSDGKINKALFAVNAPWIVFSFIVLRIQALISSENKIDRIGRSHWYIASYPGFKYKNIEFDYIIDLTAEFPKANCENKNYVCYPNLDGVELSHLSIIETINVDSKVLVHCAQGHGRSATYCAVVMSQMGFYSNPLEAYNEILISRPKAKGASD